MFISDLSIKQPVLATMVSVALVVLGAFSYSRLSIDLYPDVEIPVLTVQTEYPGVSPETVEREVTKRIEEVVNTVSGVKHISSITTEGYSSVVIEFNLGTRLANAQQDSQAKINSIRAQFPREMKEPVIQRFDIGSLPIVSIAVESPTADIKALSSLAEKTIKKRIETVPGVGQVNMVGLARREIQILADRDQLKAYRVSYAELSQALARRTWTCQRASSNRARSNRWFASPASTGMSMNSGTSSSPTAPAGRSTCRRWRALSTASRTAAARR